MSRHVLTITYTLRNIPEAIYCCYTLVVLLGLCMPTLLATIPSMGELQVFV